MIRILLTRSPSGAEKTFSENLNLTKVHISSALRTLHVKMQQNVISYVVIH